VTSVELVGAGFLAVAVGFLGVLLAFWAWDRNDRQVVERQDRARAGMNAVRVYCALHGAFLVTARSCQVDDGRWLVVVPCPAGHAVALRAGPWERLYLASWGAPETWPAGCLMELVDDLDRFARGGMML
jgi:hypothetical protein